MVFNHQFNQQAVKHREGDDFDPHENITVVNIVVSSGLGKDVPLERMAATVPNTEYNPEQFPGLVIKFREPKTSALIFSSGKIVCTGAKSLEGVEKSLEKIVEAVSRIDIEFDGIPEYEVQNIVASGNIGADLNLNVLAMSLDNTEYEPEQFPGLVYKLGTTKATFLLFSNGKIVCTGTKHEDQVHEAVDKLLENLEALDD
jgi:transcription initiation factor TFIID TATA-box-binding protein